VKGQSEKMSLESCLKLTATDGRGAEVKWQWVPDNWSCDEEAPLSEPSCSGSWNEQMGVPRRQPHRRSGLATLPFVGAVP